MNNYTYIIDFGFTCADDDRIEAMKKEMAEAEELERKKREEGDQPVIEDTATATGRERVSRAERRPRIRDESSDSDKE